MSEIEETAEEAETSADTRLVRELAEVLTETGLTEIELERGDLRVRVTKSQAAPQVQFAPLSAPPPAAPAAAAQAQAPAQTAPPAVGETVKSPMVGTVYLQPQPGSPPFARAGDRVSEGQTLLLVEAMKTMNPITAPKAGVLIEYLVSDGQPVEYGEPLVVID
jgi:acetyl-CoA carboxylase biotin carboxyl carrier protein